MTPLKSIRARCLDCTAGNDADVRRCEILDCALHHLRMGRGSKGAGGCLRPIRRYCLRCMGGQAAEVRQCPSELCALFPYKSGHSPRLEAHTGTIPGRTAPTGSRGRAEEDQPPLWPVEAQAGDMP